jgi:hypothetical protein
MIGPQIFHVLTEFRFEVGQALVGTKQVQGAVESVSAAADQALLSFQRLSTGIVGYMGLGTGSILSMFQSAIQASEKFEQSQRNIANVFLSNKMFSGPDSFVNSMSAAEKAMAGINKKAQQFALPVEPMIKLTTQIGEQLIAEKLDDTSLKNTIELARGYAKSAGILGFDPELAIGQLRRTVQGGASMGDPLFASLVAGTESMKGLRQGGDASKRFNAMAPAERLKVLTASLTQFGNVAEIVNQNATSLTSQINVLKESLFGMFSIFRPIGKVLADFLKTSLGRLNIYLKYEGKEIGKNIARMIDGLIKSPRSLFIMLKQMQGLKTDSSIAYTIMSIVGGLLSLHAVLGMLGIQFIWLNKFALVATRLIGSGLVVGIIGAISGFMVLLGVLQLFRRARAIASADDMEHVAKAMPAFTDAMARLKEFFMKNFGFLFDVFDKVAGWISVLFRQSFWIEVATDLLNIFIDTFAVLVGTLQGTIWAIMQMVRDFTSLVTGKMSFATFMQNGLEEFQSGFNDVWDQAQGYDSQTGKGIVNQTTNIGHVNINNNFKEQLEPDRIAFTLVEQLGKVAQNPNQGSGRSLSGSLVGR